MSLPDLPRVFSGQATQNRVWSEAGCEHLPDILQKFVFGVNFFLVFLSLLTNGSSFLVFFVFCCFFVFFFLCHLRPSGPRITS